VNDTGQWFAFVETRYFVPIYAPGTTLQTGTLEIVAYYWSR